MIERKRCAVCGSANGMESFMLDDRVWGAAKLKADDMAHLACVEERLGRRLVVDDFTMAPINWWVRWAAERAVRPPATKSSSSSSLRRKMSDDEVADIRRLFAEGVAVVEIAKRFKIHRETARRIANGNRSGARR